MKLTIGYSNHHLFDKGFYTYFYKCEIPHSWWIGVIKSSYHEKERKKEQKKKKEAFIKKEP